MTNRILKPLLSFALIIMMILPLPCFSSFALADIGDIVDAALGIIYVNEGSYTSVNPNDNGAVSVGKLQWHADRALNLLKTIVSANPSNARSILGSSLYNEIISSGTDWSSRTVTSGESSRISQLLGTTEGHTAQDEYVYRKTVHK